MTLKTIARAGVALAALALPLAAVHGEEVKPAPVASLIAKVDIPYQRFTLPNGLRVIVHTDRKAPVVAVSVWYNIGSKFEPKGRTGFARKSYLSKDWLVQVAGDVGERATMYRNQLVACGKA